MKNTTKLHDPCELRSLPRLELPEDLWPAIQDRLANHKSEKKSRRPVWLALAASILLTAFLVNQFYLQNSPDLNQAIDLNQLSNKQNQIEPTDTPANSTGIPANSILYENQTERLLAMSQKLENRIQGYKYQDASVSAREAIVIAELEDMIAIVDEQLSLQSEDPELWYRRVALLADLTTVYDQRRIRNYSQYVAL